MKYILFCSSREPFSEVNFSFIETELPQGVIPAKAGIHNMKSTSERLDPLSSQG